MAWGDVLRPKKKMQQDQAAIAGMGAPTAAPKPQAMGGPVPGAPPMPGTSGTSPRQAGAVAPPPVMDFGQGNVGRPNITPTAPTRPVTPPSPPKPMPQPGFTPAAPPEPAPAAGTDAPPVETPATADDIDQMIRDLVAEQLRGAGKADTAEEEALIRQQMQGELGSSLVNQRARAGRAGMASSGALMAQEGDIKRAAEMDALDQILGLRRTEDQRGIDNAMGAIDAETGMRRAAADDALRRMALEALQAEMGLDAGPGPTDIGNTETGRTRIEPADLDGDGTVSNQERDRYEQDTVDPYMAGSTAASEFFNGGGNAADLPAQPPGGDVIALRQPAVDVDGNERPGVSYNTKTGQLGRF